MSPEPTVDTAGLDLLQVERLEVRPTSPTGTGYDAAFLGRVVRPPRAAPGVGDPVLLDGKSSLPYLHYSVSLSRSRRLARWVAWNIDAATLRGGDTVSRSGIAFAADPRIPAELQVLDDVYSHNRLDRGHIARRADLLWGSSDAEVAQANLESFFFPNITPQMDTFNQSGQDGIWGKLENAVTEFVAKTPLPRVSVFGGPVLGATDPTYRGVQVPLEFWKVLVYVVDDRLRARAFLVTQNLDGLDRLTLDDDYVTYGVPVRELQDRTGLRFPVVVVRADLKAAPQAMTEPTRIDDAYAVRW